MGIYDELTINQSPLLMSLITLGMVIFLIYKNPESRIARTFVVAASFGVGVLVCSGLIFTLHGNVSWIVISGKGLNIEHVEVSTLLNRLEIAFVLMWLASMLHFSVKFNTQYKEIPLPLYPKLIVYIPATIISILSCFTPWILESITVSHADTFFKYSIGREEGPLYMTVFLPFFAIILISVFYYYIRGLRRSQSDIERSQILFTMLGFVPGIAVGLVASAVLPAMKIYTVWALGISVTAIIVLSMVFYTVVAHGMMAITTVIHKTVVWVIVSLTIWLPFSVGYFLLVRFDVLTEDNIGMFATNPGIGLVIVLGGFILLNAYSKVIQPRIDGLFQRKKFDLDEELNNFLFEASFLRGINELIDKIISLLSRVLYIDKMSILLRDETTNNFNLARANFVLNDEITITPDHPFMKWISEHDDIVEFANLMSDHAFMENKQRTKETEKYFDTLNAKISLPMIYEGKLIGVLNLGGKSNLKNYNYTDFEFLAKLKLELAIAITNSQLFEHTQQQKKELEKLNEEITSFNIELEKKVEERTQKLSLAIKELEAKDKITESELDKARLIQTGLLPLLDEEWNGVRIVTKYTPLTKVSGDFYDVFQLQNDRLGIFVADVSGHGIPAALVTTMLKTTSTQLALTTGSVAEILTGLNEKIVKILTTEEYLTAFMISIDQSHEIRWSNAGHQKALLLRRRDVSVEELDSDGIIIGAFEADFPFGEGSSQLYPGDRIVIFTDGIIEGKNKKREEYSLERFTKLLVENMDRDIGEVADLIYGDFMNHVDNEPNDDVTLVIVEIDPNYATFRSAINSGISCYNKAQYDEALPNLLKAYGFKPHHLRVLLALGKTYFKLREYSEAIHYYLEYSKIDPSYPEIFYNLGTCYYHLGDYEKSAQVNQRAINLRRNFTHAYFNLAMSLKKQQKFEKAHDTLVQVLEIDPTNKYARKELKVLAGEIEE